MWGEENNRDNNSDNDKIAIVGIEWRGVGLGYLRITPGISLRKRERKWTASRWTCGFQMTNYCSRKEVRMIPVAIRDFRRCIWREMVERRQSGGERNGEGDRTREERMRGRLMETRGETMNTKGVSVTGSRVLSFKIHLTEATRRQLPRTLVTEIGQSPSVLFWSPIGDEGRFVKVSLQLRQYLSRWSAWRSS